MSTCTISVPTYRLHRTQCYYVVRTFCLQTIACFPPDVMSINHQPVIYASYNLLHYLCTLTYLCNKGLFNATTGNVPTLCNAINQVDSDKYGTDN